VRVTSSPPPGWSPWRAVVGFGLVSLAGDFVYEGARSISGPLLASLGASALLVGLVAGAGEAASLVLRLFFGTLADRTGSYWRLTFIGYGLTAVSVPLLAFTPFIGATGLTVACVLLLAERTGKAVRSPSKSALLALASEGIGRGRGFGVHKALDQVGALSGPLVVAGVVALSARIWPAMAVLAIPGVVTMLLLARIRSNMAHRSPDPTPSVSEADAAGWISVVFGSDLPRGFFLFAAAAAATTAGLVGYGLIGFHLTTRAIVSTAVVPLLYALAMAAGAVAAIGSGWVYDRHGGKVLFALPVLVTIVPALTFTRSLPSVVIGVVIWGAAVGLQDSTVKALVADLVPASRRATAYGVFAAIQGGAAVLGGGISGFLYSRSVDGLVLVVAGVQAIAVLVLVLALRPRGRLPAGTR
jgi:MFS family permease